jgi:hypothetical protein
MRIKTESVSNESNESELQNGKHSERRNWTWRGLVIDLKAQYKNALDSMRVNSESVSNEIGESSWQDRKHFEQRIWRRRGIVIDLREEQP